MRSSREKFEDWFENYTGCDAKNKIYGNMVEMYWQSWQASRAAIEIELPSKGDPADFFCEVYSCDMVHESLANCGLKVKS